MNQQRTYYLQVDQEQAQVIFAGLGELPAKISLATIDSFRQQIAQQDQALNMAQSVAAAQNPSAAAQNPSAAPINADNKEVN